uniref:Uncharacterized protein n=1 Tax=Solanum lycopersicum TaxID=4081 RepID=A0A3Q7FWF1_SOLLC
MTIVLGGNVLLQQSTTLEEGSDVTSSKLREDLQAVFHVLPKDMQQLMLMNPERAALELNFSMICCKITLAKNYYLLKLFRCTEITFFF